MLIRLAGKIHDFRWGKTGESSGDLPLDYAFSYAERAISESADALAHSACPLPAESAQRFDRSAHRVVLGAVRHGRLRPHFFRVAHPRSHSHEGRRAGGTTW
jgi:hypothetical protein